MLSNSPAHAEHVLLLCELAGYDPYLATNRPDLQPDAARLTIRMAPGRREEPVRVAATLNEIARVHRVRVLVPADTAFTLWLIENQEHLRTRCFPLAEIEAFRTLRNKASFARLAQGLGIEHPPTIAVRLASQIETVDMDCPVMVKPTLREGGYLVVKEENQRSLGSTVRRVLEKNRGPVIVQRFVPGQDIDLSVLARNGNILRHTIQQRTADGITFCEHDRVLAIGKAICGQTRLTGLLHLDMRIECDTERVVVIEANPRVWASISDSLRAGVNFIEAGLRLADRPMAQSRD